MIRPHMELGFGHILSHINTVYVLATKPGVLVNSLTANASTPNLGALPSAQNNMHASQSTPNMVYTDSLPNLNGEGGVSTPVGMSPQHHSGDPHHHYKDRDRDTSVMRLKGQ